MKRARCRERDMMVLRQPRAGQRATMIDAGAIRDSVEER